MATVRVNGIELYYELHGAGEPVVLIQGLGANITGWDLQLEPLSRQYQLIAFDNRGAGRSEKPEEPYSIHQMADDTAALMDELGIESAHVVGHSMGGMLAAELAALCPHRVRRLVLANPVGLWRDDEPVLDEFTLSPDQLAPHIWHDPQSEAVKEAFPAPEGKDAIVEMLFQRMQSYTSAGKFLWPIPDRGLKRRIHRIQSPTLIVWGESDRLVPPSYAEDFRSRIKNAQVVILPECAHMPMFEKRDDFVALVTDFLNGD